MPVEHVRRVGTCGICELSRWVSLRGGGDGQFSFSFFGIAKITSWFEASGGLCPSDGFVFVWILGRFLKGLGPFFHHPVHEI